MLPRIQPVRMKWIFSGIILLTAATAWSQQRQGGSTMSFKLNSTSFQPERDIPSKYTCSGADVSPALSWTDPPAGTQSFALIADDPDAPAGTWVHWVAYDLPASARQLPEGVPKADALPGGGVQGQNDFRKTGYGGPCPPPGKPHRYYFKLYALDNKLNLKPGATKKAVEQAMQGHILAQAELMGRFQR
jgi:Raf kinase inhibitor-like YbhB/YbcL family protein